MENAFLPPPPTPAGGGVENLVSDVRCQILRFDPPLVNISDFAKGGGGSNLRDSTDVL